MTTQRSPHDELLRDLYPEVLGALVRRYGQLDICDDAVQEALLTASQKWLLEGSPANPAGWLLTVARRRMIDQIRSDTARRRREDHHVETEPHDQRVGIEPETLTSSQDDTLQVLFLCAHPSLSSASQMALTLRSVGGLNTAEIAKAFLVPEATMTRRLSRARQQIAAVVEEQGSLGPIDYRQRLEVVLHVLYLIFNEGYTATAGDSLQRHDLAAEAIRLTRLVIRLLPEEPEVCGLLSLMLLTDSRHAARTAPDGSLVPITAQDRTQWSQTEITEAVNLLMPTLAQGRVGPYQLQAAIAAVHAEASSADCTDWHQIVGLYRLLEQVAPNPMVTLNRVVAEAEANGVDAAQQLFETLSANPKISESHRFWTVKAHLAELAGDLKQAAEHYEEAARRTLSKPEQRHLRNKARQLIGSSNAESEGDG